MLVEVFRGKTVPTTVQPLLDPFGVRWYEIKRIVGHLVLGHVARVLGSVGGLGCVLDSWTEPGPWKRYEKEAVCPPRVDPYS